MTLHTDDIYKELKKGGQWVLGSNALVFPAQYINAIILGRLNPEALGTYQLLRLLARIIPSLTMFGGQRTLLTLVPKITVPRDRIRFLRSFFLLFVFFLVILVGLLLIYPNILSRIIPRGIEFPYVFLFCVFAIFISFRETLGTVVVLT